MCELTSLNHWITPFKTAEYRLIIFLRHKKKLLLVPLSIKVQLFSLGQVYSHLAFWTNINITIIQIIIEQPEKDSIW